MSMSKGDAFNTYRQRYSEFVYDSYQYDVQSDGLHIAFCFRIGELVFRPTAFIPTRPFLEARRLSTEQLNMLVFHIGMIELISYWKCYCPPTVIVRPYRLNDEQVAFWKKIYYNGLGEFFYTNEIDTSYADFLNIRFEATRTLATALYTAPCDGEPLYLVPVGGGKDSVVSLELLKTTSKQVIPLIMNPRGATRDCVARAGYTMQQVLVIERHLDEELLEQNKKGALNGHTPFSALLAFYTILAAALTGRSCRIALSNENSANESTVVGSLVNHQYSKSVEFEDDCRRYAAQFATGVEYFSFLRPLSELQIAMLFARYGHYHDVFRSCNVGSKQDVWCGHCAKCLFAYIILSPFIEPEQLRGMFGKDMLDDETLRTEFEQLTGQAETKPFECVGTVSEVRDALTLALARWYPDERPALLRDYKPAPVVTRLDTLAQHHNLTQEETALLGSALLASQSQASGVATDLAFYRSVDFFNLLAFKNILIAGYGKEGKSSHALLQRLFPRSRRIDIACNDKEIATALACRPYDLILKSPGIPTAFFDDRCDATTLSSQTDLFLRVYHDQTIGVTGTKGKSTTASLLHHVLQHCTARKVLLAGNIGLPVAEIIPLMSSHALVVAELSCHQLEIIHNAPHIGILLNLYQEHLDHYRSYEDYKWAKFQMAVKQKPSDFFVYCTDNDEVVQLVAANASTLRQTLLPYSLGEAQQAMPDSDTLPLKGTHNLSNIYAVWLVAKQFAINMPQFREALADFHPLEHRLEYVATKGGVVYYNDSISTIPQTTMAALQALSTVQTLILGGFDRGIDYHPLAEYLIRQPLGVAVRNLVFFGSAGHALWQQIGRLADITDRKVLCHFEADYSMEEAVHFAQQNTEAGKICLLSPAASSYDHYKNFEYRGADFKQCVKQL